MATVLISVAAPAFNPRLERAAADVCVPGPGCVSEQAWIDAANQMVAYTIETAHFALAFCAQNDCQGLVVSTANTALGIANDYAASACSSGGTCEGYVRLLAAEVVAMTLALGNAAAQIVGDPQLWINLAMSSVTLAQELAAGLPSYAATTAAQLATLAVEIAGGVVTVAPALIQGALDIANLAIGVYNDLAGPLVDSYVQALTSFATQPDAAVQLMVQNAESIAAAAALLVQTVAGPTADAAVATAMQTLAAGLATIEGTLLTVLSQVPTVDPNSAIALVQGTLQQLSDAANRALARPSIVVSTSSDRSGAVPLADATLVGNAYVHLSTPAGDVSKVRWWLDDPHQEDPEGNAPTIAPFDLVGTVGGLALPLDTASFREGVHYVTAEVDSSSGTSTLVSQFTIDNRTTAQERQAYRAASGHYPLKWPVSGLVTSAYGQRWGRLHAGVDVSAPIGTPLYAAYGGTIRFAAPRSGYGNTVEIQHVNGYWTRYAHMDRFAPGITEGAPVAQGDVIGASGNTGNSEGPHLHFEVRDANNVALDTNDAYEVNDRVTARTTFRYALNMPVTDATGATIPTGFVDMTSRTDGGGYWLVHADGRVTGHGSAAVFGHRHAENDVDMVGIARHPNNTGYWLAGKNGGVYSFGATFFGSLGGTPLNQPIVGIEPTPSGNGYWLVAADGGVFTFGDAAFHGSAGGMTLNQPVVGMSATPSGLGYWLVAADGGIFTYGDATFFGSGANPAPNAAAVAVSRTTSGAGYWIGFADGGVFTFGDAPFAGSAGGARINSPVTDIEATTASGYRGYWLHATDGGVFSYDAPFFGSGA